MMLFDRIKQSLASGEADGAVRKLGRDPARLRRDLGMRPRPGEEVAA